MKEVLNKAKAVMRFNWQGDLEYRSYFLFWAFVESLPFLIMFFLWKFIYADRSVIAGYDLSQMITYYFLVFVIDRLTTMYIEWNLSGRIQGGMFTQFMYRPLPHRLYYFAQSISDRATRVLITLPVFLAGLFIFGKYLLWTGPINLALMLFALLFVWGINYFLGLLVGYFGFWLERADSVIYFRWSLTYYLSGQFLPLNFFGPTIARLLSFLPFFYIYSFPIQLYLGKLSTTEIYAGFLMAFVWVVALATLDFFVFRRGIKRFKAIGN